MKLASIETVSSVRPHPNADRLEIATVLGWQTIIVKGSFEPGDRCVFVVIDTILPPTPWSAFLADKKAPESNIRLKTAKLRGEFSQGLALPVSVLPEHVQSWREGADVGGELGIRKYEKQMPACLSGIVKSTFPVHLAAKTDEDNGLSNLKIVDYVLSLGRSVLTMKLDGSSCTVIYEKGVGVVEVCSRNMALCEDDKNAFWRAVKPLKWNELESMDGQRFIFQGELMGPGIQGNQLHLDAPTLYLFQVKADTDFLPQAEVLGIARIIGCQACPVVSFAVETSLAEIQQTADGLKLPDGKPAEGVVVRPVNPIAFGNGRPASFKIINRNYLDT